MALLAWQRPQQVQQVEVAILNAVEYRLSMIAAWRQVTRDAGNDDGHVETVLLSVCFSALRGV